MFLDACSQEQHKKNPKEVTGTVRPLLKYCHGHCIFYVESSTNQQTYTIVLCLAFWTTMGCGRMPLQIRFHLSRRCCIHATSPHSLLVLAFDDVLYHQYGMYVSLVPREYDTYYII